MDSVLCGPSPRSWQLSFLRLTSHGRKMPCRGSPPCLRWLSHGELRAALGIVGLLSIGSSLSKS
eukprot:8959702-Pyramimonas_sp.AAC.1